MRKTFNAVFIRLLVGLGLIVLLPMIWKNAYVTFSLGPMIYYVMTSSALLLYLIIWYFYY